MQNSIEPKLSNKLIRLQTWFGRQISLVPGKDPAETKKIESAISVQRHLLPCEALDIYRLQHWSRLLNTLSDQYPCLARLVGRRFFNEKIALPFLQHHKGNDFRLSHLGEKLPKWLETHLAYEKHLINIAHIDWAFEKALWSASEKVSLSKKSKKWVLQPHVSLFKCHWGIFSWRDTLLKESVEHWQSNELPSLKKKRGYYLVFRNPTFHIIWQPLSGNEYQLLSQFKKKNTLQVACTWIESKSIGQRQKIFELLPVWFYDWTFNQIIKESL